jgi:hypothetical protein
MAAALFSFLRKNLSPLTILFILAVSTQVGLKYERWKTESIVQNDVINYYQYLPAFFIHHDLSFRFIDSLGSMNDHQSKYYYMYTPDSEYVDKMTMGVAMLVSPFFLTAHEVALLSHESITGYSSTYEFFVFLAALFYFAIGLIYLRKTLMYFGFSETVIALAIITIGLATNLLNYAAFESGMGHVYSFAAFSFFLFYTLKWCTNPKIKYSILMGLAGGFIVLIRPTNGIIFLIPALLFVFDAKSAQQKLSFFSKNFLSMLIAAGAACLVLLPQLIYWKYATGHFLYYSYYNERFYFLQPHIIKGLFSFRKGMFVYAPVLLFIFPGMYLSLVRKKPFALLTPIFFLLNAYIIFSWWCWWYGGSLGSRPMVDCYALLALPLAVFYQWVFEKKIIYKIILISSICFFSWLIYFQIKQYSLTLLRWDGMTSRSYFKIFGTTKFPENYALYMCPSDNENALKGLPEREIIDDTYAWLPIVDSIRTGIKTYNGKYVSADRGIHKVVANRNFIGLWEKFLFVRRVQGYCRIQSFENNYVEVDTLHHLNHLMAEKPYQWERQMFQIVDLPNNHFALKCYDGSYVTVLSDSVFTVGTGAAKITDAQTFEWVKQ